MIRTMLFDLDGTILDTNELIIQSFLHAFLEMKERPLTREHIILHMGLPLTEQMQYFSGLDDVDDLIAKYRKYNVDKHDELVTAFPNVVQTLQELHDSGVKLGVVTSKIKLTTEMGLKLTGMYSFFDSIITVEDVSKAKPDPEGILKALEELGGDKASALMVGDSHYDIEAAHNAGISSAAVGWSLKGPEHLRKYKPTYLIEDIRELLPLVRNGEISV